MTLKYSHAANSIFPSAKKTSQLYDLHIDLLKLRREDSRFRQQTPGGIDGAALGTTSFVLRYFSKEDDDRLLLVNFGERQVLHPASEPLLAPPSRCTWETFWTSESPRYGGAGVAPIASKETMDSASRIHDSVAAATIKKMTKQQC